MCYLFLHETSILLAVGAKISNVIKTAARRSRVYGVGFRQRRLQDFTTCVANVLLICC